MIATASTPGALDLVREGEARLGAAGIEAPRVEAEWLLAGAVGGGRYDAYLEPARQLGPDGVARYRDLLARRAAHEPLQYLVGFEDFHGHRLVVTPDVLIPRPETEGLVEWAVQVLAPHAAPRAADVGTGSGAIACALASRLPGVRVLATDRSPAALAVASDNVARLGLGDRIGLLAGDLLAPVGRGILDVVVANPPYIASAAIASLPLEVRGFEPRAALDGGPDGLTVLRRLVAEAPAALGQGGWLIMEIGEDQAGAMAAILGAAGFDRIEVRRDLRGAERYIAGQWTRPARRTC